MFCVSPNFLAMASIIPELAYELPPFVRVYKDGTVERLMGTEITPPAIDAHTGVQSKDVVFSPETALSARLYKPRTTTHRKQKHPLILYFHGGGFYVQTPFSPIYQSFLHSLVAESNSILVSIDYRRAPEYPQPIGYDDSWAGVKWVASHSMNGGGPDAWINEYADFQRVFFVGDSAGANIAHNMAMRAGAEKLDGVRIEGLVLMHPYFWGKDPVGAEDTDRNNRAGVEKYWILACPSTSGSDDPLMNPGLDPKLWSLGCNKVLVFVAELDFLRYRGWYYYEALVKSGWGGVAEIMESEGEEHVFHLFNPNCDKAIHVIKRVVSFMGQDN